MFTHAIYSSFERPCQNPSNKTLKRQYLFKKIYKLYSYYFNISSEIEDVPAPDFLPGFVFGCVIMAGLTGIIVGLCLRIETIRR